MLGNGYTARPAGRAGILYRGVEGYGEDYWH